MDVKMDLNSLSPSTAVDTPPKAEVDDFLRRKRKVREHKACYPCRQRKVRCDLNRPCKTCVEREHPELCDYHPPAKRQNMGLPAVSSAAHDDGTGPPTPFSTTGAATVTISHADFASLLNKLDGLESNIEDLRRELRAANRSNALNRALDVSGPSTPLVNGRSVFDGPKADLPISSAALPGFHTRNALTGETVYIGGSSVPALVMALGQGSRDQLNVEGILGKSILPLFGLDNETATYPFVDLWGLANGWTAKATQLAKTIPSDSQCVSFLQYYRDLGHVIYPGLADIAAFETDLTTFLMNRAGYAEMGVRAGTNDNELPPGVTEQALFDKDFNWIGLLFAVLSSGCQSSNLPRKERELTSQVYVCCSLECLRFTNFLSMPTLESVQAMLVLCHVISNNMNAGTSWNLIGLTARLAQSLGLHQECPEETPVAMKALRSKIWWTLMQQDSLLSITYDRASFTALVDHAAMANPRNHIGITAFHSAMLRVCKVGLDVVRDRSKPMPPTERYERIAASNDEINVVLREVAEHLRDSRKCRSMRESVEHWALYLHVSYITAELFRPALSPQIAADPKLPRHFRQTCLESLGNTVEAWLGLQNITTYARHSWAALHRALSSALLLGILGEHKTSDKCRRLLSRFIGLMGDMTSGVEPAELAAPMTRAISALRKLRINETITATPSPRSAPPGLQPPLPQHQHVHPTQPQQIHIQQQQNRYPPGFPGPSAQPLRFIEDIALGGPSPRPSGDAASPSAMSWPGSAHSRVASVHGSHSGSSNGDEQSPYSVLNNILWGGKGMGSAMG
ncbi:hypothetical protein K461DRAFT_317884 [Myriangium duriaei CBS 260.36]|uniref:Zn(2)-C6 fungal-type domain-containing protein n=1 Tax=Myriangium duriaei CBS 260.36 TaxID=1168546 RepID=A0A9P4JDY9_9PEZI|nr:hypothetical protein K461DRAFT_317884 [Myriangium duriaei CBS 260.36]